MKMKIDLVRLLQEHDESGLDECCPHTATLKRADDAVKAKLVELQADYDHAWQDRESAQERMNDAQAQAEALGVNLA